MDFHNAPPVAETTELRLGFAGPDLALRIVLPLKCNESRFPLKGQLQPLAHCALTREIKLCGNDCEAISIWNHQTSFRAFQTNVYRR